MRSGGSQAVKLSMLVFWFVMPCSPEDGCSTCSETLVYNYNIVCGGDLKTIFPLHLPNAVAGWLSLLHRIWYFLGSNLGRRPVTEVFLGFPQPLNANAGIDLKLCHGRFLPHPLQFIYHPFIRREIVLSY
jgi:hypothetical protein